MIDAREDVLRLADALEGLTSRMKHRATVDYMLNRYARDLLAADRPLDPLTPEQVADLTAHALNIDFDRVRLESLEGALNNTLWMFIRQALNATNAEYSQTQEALREHQNRGRIVADQAAHRERAEAMRDIPPQAALRDGWRAPSERAWAEKRQVLNVHLDALRLRARRLRAAQVSDPTDRVWLVALARSSDLESACMEPPAQEEEPAMIGPIPPLSSTEV